MTTAPSKANNTHPARQPNASNKTSKSTNDTNSRANHLPRVQKAGRKTRAEDASEDVSSDQASTNKPATTTIATSTSIYSAQLSSLQELFSQTWDDDDLTAVLNEVGGDLEVAIARISEGIIRIRVGIH